MGNVLITTILDSRGSRAWRTMGKLWVSSLLRHLWDGKLLLTRNFDEVLFPVERAGIEERTLCKPLDLKGPPADGWLRAARREQLETAAGLEEPGQFGWVVLADADCR